MSDVNQLYFRTIWISDIHLGSKHVNSEYLLDFLKKTHCEYLYLVGDIIDFWKLKKSRYWPQINNHIVRNVLAKARNGTKVIYIPGNHDEILREYVGQKLHHVEISRDAIHVTVSGKKFLVTHGDEFDYVIRKNKWLAILGSGAYELLLELNTVLNYLRTQLGLPYWSISAYLKSKVKKIVNFIGRYEKEVAELARSKNVDGYICGHIHQAASKNIRGIMYKNIGDWMESCTALTEDTEGELNIVYWTGKQDAAACPSELYENCYHHRRLAPTG